MTEQNTEIQSTEIKRPQELPEWPVNWPCAWGLPAATADIRQQNSDFRVEELISDGLFQGGEHQCIQVEKEGQNTAYVARRLANHAGVREMDVGYCGLKDRNAVTTQWFSIYYGKRPRWNPDNLDLDGVRVRQVASFSRKLRRGDHSGNRFRLKLTNPVGDKSEVERRLMRVSDNGVPNYFGEQRFGRDGHNLKVAHQWFTGQKRMKVRQGAIYISAARSFLFNCLLAERVANGNWCSPVDGDRVVDAALQLSLFGDGEPLESGEASGYSRHIEEAHAVFANGLRSNRIAMAYRDAVCKPKSLQWEWEGDNLWIIFELQPGSYATSVLREIATIRDVSLLRQKQA